MMQTEVRGRDKVAFLESLTTADLINMPDNTATLAVFTDPLTGGILDDLIITKTTLGYYHIVSNAARRSQDQKLLQEAQVSAVGKQSREICCENALSWNSRSDLYSVHLIKSCCWLVL
jgi:glycine cleavage system aminomethyltransferase T